MGKTAAERQRERRKRLKENTEEYEAQKEKDRLRKVGKPRKVQKDRSKEEAKIVREKERNRKRKYRQNLKENFCKVGLSSTKPCYNTPQSKGKAVKRVMLALPSSPRKARTVVKELVTKLGVTNSPKKTSHKKDPIGVIMEEKVIEFFQRDDISRQAPGRKDVKTIRCDGIKTKYQKRHMFTTIAEAYQIFKKEHPDAKIGKSKFFSLRPKFVLPFDEMPHNSCLCRYHENVNLLLLALSSPCKDIPIKTVDLISEVVCSPDNEKCMTDNCTLCGTDKLENQFQSLLYDMTDLTWFSWETHEGKLIKAVKEGTIALAFSELVAKFSEFLKHCFLVKAQSQYFREMRSLADGTQIVLQVDFAENFNVRQQNEIQSAYWGYQQVTIFTAVAWISSATLQSFAIISDELSHDKYSVNVFLVDLLKILKETFPTIRAVNIFSDGAASQFKQRYTLCNMTFIQEETELNLTWNFFATSHGKGSVDGIGGEVKRQVWTAVLSGKHIVTDAKSFYSCAKSLMKSTAVIFHPKEKIDETKQHFDDRIQDVQSLPDTHSIHYVKALSPYTVIYKKHSQSVESTKFNFLTAEKAEQTLIVQNVPKNVAGTFVIVRFEAKKGVKQFVGQILSVDNDEFEISFMRKVTTDYKFCFKPNDSAWVSKTNILKNLPVPEMDNRQRYFFPGLDFSHVE